MALDQQSPFELESETQVQMRALLIQMALSDADLKTARAHALMTFGGWLFQDVR